MKLFEDRVIYPLSSLHVAIISDKTHKNKNKNKQTNRETRVSLFFPYERNAEQVPLEEILSIPTIVSITHCPKQLIKQL